MTRTIIPSTPTRRRFLQGASAVAGAALLPAGADAQAPKKLVYVVWTYEPQTHREMADRFEAENPGYKVEIVTVPVRDYIKKITAMMSAGEQVDVMLVYNFHVASWSEAGYLQPIDGMPGLDRLNGAMFPFVRDIMGYKGKQYGLPYYADIAVFAYNEAILGRAGITAPPRDLEELRQQALRIKQSGGMDYPIIFEAKQSPNAMYFYYGLVYASGGGFFDAELNPTFPERDSAPEAVLDWLIRAIHEWKIVDMRSLEMDLSAIRDTFSAGQAAYTITHRYYLRHINNPAVSKIPGQAKVARFPGLHASGGSVEGWARLYGLGGTSKDKEGAWKLMSFLGGTDKAGRYVVAERWAELQGLGPGYAPVAENPAVVAGLKTWVDTELTQKESTRAKVREISKATWYPEFDIFMQQQVQRALLKQVSPRDALAAAAAKARELKQRA
jgi:ABC-type glycerol-3-phosphate transport system substrate-binding protein